MQGVMACKRTTRNGVSEQSRNCQCGKHDGVKVRKVLRPKQVKKRNIWLEQIDADLMLGKLIRKEVVKENC